MSLEMVRAKKDTNMSICEVRNHIAKNLKEGFDYDESIPSVALSKEAEELTSKFFDMCEEGVNPFEAFVKAFY